MFSFTEYQHSSSACRRTLCNVMGQRSVAQSPPGRFHADQWQSSRSSLPGPPIKIHGEFPRSRVKLLCQKGNFALDAFASQHKLAGADHHQQTATVNICLTWQWRSLNMCVVHVSCQTQTLVTISRRLWPRRSSLPIYWSMILCSPCSPSPKKQH